MDETGITEPCLLISEARGDNSYPMYFGISCALFALKLLAKQELDDEKRSEIRNKMLFLLGLLVWRVQRERTNAKEKCELLHELETAEREIEELKKIRSEDAKANEKVVSIHAAKEQSWLYEKKNLGQQFSALLNDLRILKKHKDQFVAELKHKDGFLSELKQKLQEMEILVKSKDKIVREEEKKMELEEKLKTIETTVEELKETAKRDAHLHSSELWKHKAALIELVSNQRRLEAEISRALRQAEAAKEQLELLFDEKEELMLMTEKLSTENENMQKDLEHKEKILSALLRKSKLERAEKQMLLKEIKLSKAKRKQEELKRNERITLKSMLSKQVSSTMEAFPCEIGRNSVQMGLFNARRAKSQPNDGAFNYVNAEINKAPRDYHYSLKFNQISREGDKEFEISADAKGSEGWFPSKSERYPNAIENWRRFELEEQMKLKGDKLETYRWHLLSMDLESKRLQSHLQDDKIKLQKPLPEGEELNSLKGQISLHLNSLNSPKTKLHSSMHEFPLADDIVWSKVKILKRKSAEKDQDAKKNLLEAEKNEVVESLSKVTALAVKSFAEDSEEGKEESVPVCEKLKTDLHALGVSCKIKWLKQQLILLERLTANVENGESMENEDQGQSQIKGFFPLLSLLNKQVNRYQSLQGKIDDLCNQMHDNRLDIIQGESSLTRTKEETRTLVRFLEETFQLQRFMVATGQKLIELQAKTASMFVGIAKESDISKGFDTSRFADNVRILFKEVQRGLEIRIARIIGDLEGTLARDGIHSRK
ncbi:hypothetical protein Nepgr_031466 [Nepenthes gracilis]|uniref:Uncharacterized protein n=1 Tax=Nepenthes gracilis TaxID=150966 RepID=A0AAD3Y564_NEPGR|nr:hypothetical protein Nepgr_031466 [Nepenthes gracilis]